MVDKAVLQNEINFLRGLTLEELVVRATSMNQQNNSWYWGLANFELERRLAEDRDNKYRQQEERNIKIARWAMIAAIASAFAALIQLFQ